MVLISKTAHESTSYTAEEGRLWQQPGHGSCGGDGKRATKLCSPLHDNVALTHTKAMNAMAIATTVDTMTDTHAATKRCNYPHKRLNLAATKRRNSPHKRR